MFPSNYPYSRSRIVLTRVDRQGTAWLDVRPFKISEALGPEDYERVAAKVALHNVPDRWCGGGECACMGCANQYLSWAEYECWRKYAPEFNVTREG
jgi:hypothetical protein